MRKDLYQTLYEIEEHHWWWKWTRRIFLDFLQRTIDLYGKRVLDAGCGTGMVLEQLHRAVGGNGRVEGIDISRAAVQFCRKRKLRHVSVGSLEKLPYEANTFDVVTAFDVLEHIREDDRALQEIARVLKPGGLAVVNVPAYQWMWTGHDDAVYHFRRYTRGELAQKLVAQGLTVRRSTYMMTLLFPVAMIRKLFLRLTGNPGEELLVPPPPRPINSLLGATLWIEGWVLRWFHFPFGLSVFCIGEKKR